MGHSISQSSPRPKESLVSEFYQLRLSCPVLKDLLIPDGILDEHQRAVSAEPDEAQQSSVPFIARLGNKLGLYCKPLHRLIGPNGSLHSQVTKSYRQDLRETWILKERHLERFLKFRMFHSRWAELCLADWLAAEGWTIQNLEALGASFDLEAIDPDGVSVDFEVKYLAESEHTRLSIVSAMGDPIGNGVFYGDVYSPMNYLVVRSYDAAKQLSNSKNKKIACFIIEDYWLSFKIPLSDNPPWIAWSSPQFFNAYGPVLELINHEREKVENYDQKLIEYVSDLDEVWIMTSSNNYTLNLKHKFYPKGQRLTRKGVSFC